LILALHQNARITLWNFTLGLIYEKKGEFKESSEMYTSTIKLDSNKSLGMDPLYNRGICFVQSNNFDDALKDYRTIESNKAESRYPGFSDELGNILLEKNLSQDAEKYFHSSLSADSSDAVAQYGIATALVQQKQIDQALIWFEKSFSSGKIKKKKVTSDNLLADIKEDKQFKKLIKKYL
jgi:tetratricopeptide (TPR) repeat protein